MKTGVFTYETVFNQVSDAATEHGSYPFATPGAAILRLKFLARSGIRHEEFLMVVAGIPSKEESPGIATLQFNQQLFILFFESFEDVRVEDDADFMHGILILPHDRVQRAVQLDAGRYLCLHNAATTAVRAVFVNRVAQALLRALARHLHQA
jgi:hypothetical protein